MEQGTAPRRLTCRLLASATAAATLAAGALVTTGLVAGAGAATLPTSSALWQTCNVTLGGVTTTVDRAERTRTVVNGTGGSWAVLGFYRPHRQRLHVQAGAAGRQPGRVTTGSATV